MTPPKRRESSSSITNILTLNNLELGATAGEVRGAGAISEENGLVHHQHHLEDSEHYHTTQVEIESHFSTDDEINHPGNIFNDDQISHLPTIKIKYHRSNSVHSISSANSFDGANNISGDISLLPTIKVLGTGGTIASKGVSSHQTAGYEVDLTIEDLVSTIPDLSQTCQLEYEQVLNIDSKEMDNSSLLKLYHKIQLDLPHYDGIVITHGTDTMEETAFFLQSTINTFKPIVLCGSMRPSTAISSDGPMNLYQAIVIASNRESRGRGVLIALNDRIGSGFYITKSNANSLDTFKSIGQGYVGNFVNNEIRYFFPPAKPLGLTMFHINDLFSSSSSSSAIGGNDIIPCLPEVTIIYAHQGLNNEIFKFVINDLKSKGIILATMGAGSMSDKTNQYLSDLLINNPNYPIVYSKRSMDGMVPIGSLPKVLAVIKDAADNGKPATKKVPFVNAIAGGYLNPQKARIILQLCLNEGMDLSKIKNVFKTV